MLVDEVLPEKPIRQWVLSVPYPLRWLFAAEPEMMSKALLRENSLFVNKIEWLVVKISSMILLKNGK